MQLTCILKITNNNNNNIITIIVEEKKPTPKYPDIFCKFGTYCKKGNNCPFDHSVIVPNPIICKFGLGCKKGDKCPFNHSIIYPNPIVCRNGPNCPYFANNCCKFGHY